jgi:hypothetical protein
VVSCGNGEHRRGVGRRPLQKPTRGLQVVSPSRDEGVAWSEKMGWWFPTRVAADGFTKVEGVSWLLGATDIHEEERAAGGVKGVNFHLEVVAGDAKRKEKMNSVVWGGWTKKKKESRYHVSWKCLKEFRVYKFYISSP